MNEDDLRLEELRELSELNQELGLYDNTIIPEDSVVRLIKQAEEVLQNHDYSLTVLKDGGFNIYCNNGIITYQAENIFTMKAWVCGFMEIRNKSFDGEENT